MPYASCNSSTTLSPAIDAANPPITAPAKPPIAVPTPGKISVPNAAPASPPAQPPARLVPIPVTPFDTSRGSSLFTLMSWMFPVIFIYTLRIPPTARTVPHATVMAGPAFST